MTGYASREYAESWQEFGQPQSLLNSQGFYLRRQIPGQVDVDGRGCYPLFDCADWGRLSDDLRALPGELVSLTAVVMPFGQATEEQLRGCFPDLVRPFKDHYLIEYPGTPHGFANRHHRYYARRALSAVEVTIEPDPPRMLTEWLGLYGELIRRHNIVGMQAFSAATFSRQLAAPGLVAFRAVVESTTVAAHLWFQAGDVAYSHLLAANERGYELGAAYALYWRAIEHFADRVRWLDLGGAAGTSADAAGGLVFFKRGWSNCIRPALLCGRIVNRRRYAELAELRGLAASSYFPAYRCGELGG